WDDAFQSNKLKMSFSTDGGQTWTSSSVPGNSLGVIGGQPLVQPSGTVVMPIGGGIGLESFISTNGGSSYTGPFSISSVQVHFVHGDLRDGGGPPSADGAGGGRVSVGCRACRVRCRCSSTGLRLTPGSPGQAGHSPI